MIDAEMKRKLPEIEYMEDVLTSNVFGLLELVDYRYLLEILKKSKNIKSGQKFLVNEKVAIKSIKLWKKLATDYGKYAEPDVYIKLSDGSELIVEVKYYSGEHANEQDGEIVGQLKKYLDSIDNEKKYLIYLTANYSSVKYLDKSNLEYEDKIFYLHWEEFNNALQEIAKRPELNREEEKVLTKKVLTKVYKYLNYKGFIKFNGWRSKKFIETNNIEIIGGFYER